MKKWSSQWMQFMRSLKKVQDFNKVWTHDFVITGAMLYQLSYKATDVGSRSIVGSYVPMKEMSVRKKEHQKIAVDELTYVICFICWIF